MKINKSLGYQGDPQFLWIFYYTSLMTSTPPLIHYGLAPFKISIAPFKMLMGNF